MGRVDCVVLVEDPFSAEKQLKKVGVGRCFAVSCWLIPI